MFSHPLANQQIEAVEKVMSELDVSSIPKLVVWNKVTYSSREGHEYISIQSLALCANNVGTIIILFTPWLG